MRKLTGLLGLSVSFFGLASIAQAASIAGSVKGPDGSPFRGAFVAAQNLKTKISVTVLTQTNGRFTIRNLPAGDYEVRVKSVGYTNNEASRIALAGDQTGSKDFALAKGKVSWADLSYYQERQLLPEGPGKAQLFNYCHACHGTQSRMVGKGHEREGWESLVTYMTGSFKYFLGGRVTEQDEKEIADYLTATFGKDSNLPKSPEDLPKYQQTVHAPFSDEALKIVYTEYEMPSASSFPWSAVEDKDGKYWIPFYGNANRIARLDAETGAVEEFKTPSDETASIHSAQPAPDGSVYFTMQAQNKIGRWDPVTRKITEYQDPYETGKEGTMAGGSKHTLRVLPNGEVWSTGGPMTKFDPKTETFTKIPAIPSVYGIAGDKTGKVWFAEYTPNGVIGFADAKTLEVKRFSPPTKNARARRIQAFDDGSVWFAEFAAGKIGKFDSKTESFQEWQLPGPMPTPYAFHIDANGMAWYSSESQDVIGRLDPVSGRVVEFPLPYAENTMREFFIDSKGRMWYGTPANNRVGYFYLDQ